MSFTNRSPEDGPERTCRNCGEPIHSRDRRSRRDHSNTYRDDRAAVQEENARLRRKYDRALGDLVLEVDESTFLRRQLDDQIRRSDRLLEENTRLRRDRDGARRKLDHEARRVNRLRRERDAARGQLSLGNDNQIPRRLAAPRGRGRASEGRRGARDHSSPELDDFEWDMTPPPQPCPPERRAFTAADDDGSPNEDCDTDGMESIIYSDGEDGVDEAEEAHDVAEDGWGSD